MQPSSRLQSYLIRDGEQGKELAMMQESLKNLQYGFGRFTLEFEHYKETQATRWAKAVANPPAPVVYSRRPNFTEATAINTQERPKLAINKTAMSGLASEPRIDHNATTSISDIKASGDLVASYRQKPKGERYTFLGESLIQALLDDFP
ncbi:hypothetical protein RhiLY_09904 [Ceratobasidium sp. AG-Ba]|nr:hypothetical protein RhiLY_09904 [Ceratobasidium sp. AG-Ba]